MEKKTFKEFVKEHRGVICGVAGAVVGVGAVYFYHGDSIKLAELLNQFGPAKRDGLKLANRVSAYAARSSCVFWNDQKGITIDNIGDVIEKLKSDASEINYQNAAVEGILVFTKK
jgi:hypothetical protein